MKIEIFSFLWRTSSGKKFHSVSFFHSLLKRVYTWNVSVTAFKYKKNRIFFICFRHDHGIFHSKSWLKLRWTIFLLSLTTFSPFLCRFSFFRREKIVEKCWKWKKSSSPAWTSLFIVLHILTYTKNGEMCIKIIKIGENLIVSMSRNYKTFPFDIFSFFYVLLVVVFCGLMEETLIFLTGKDMRVKCLCVLVARHWEIKGKKREKTSLFPVLINDLTYFTWKVARRETFTSTQDTMRWRKLRKSFSSTPRKREDEEDDEKTIFLYCYCFSLMDFSFCNDVFFNFFHFNSYTINFKSFFV